MDDLRNNKELLRYKCAMELDTIMGAVDKDKLPKDRDPREYVTDRVLSSLLHKGSGTIEKVRREGTIRNTTPYILAQILRTDTVQTWVDFREEVRRRIPAYQKNPRGVLKTCGLPWVVRFNFPTLINRAPWGSKTRNGKPIEPQMSAEPTTIKTLTESFEARMESLEKQLKTVVAHIGSLDSGINSLANVAERITILENVCDNLDRAAEEMVKIRSEFTTHTHVGDKVYVEVPRKL